jgi:transketolase
VNTKKGENMLNKRDISPVEYQREKSVTALKILGVEAVNAANSGHPGIVLGAAAMTYAVFSDFLKCNPKDPH